MREAPGILEAAPIEPPADDLLLIAPDGGSHAFRDFVQNFRELFSRSDLTAVDGSSATFWPDVFVEARVPWLRFGQSGAYHILALALVWAGSRFLAMQPRIATQNTFTRADVVYYQPSEYLPPLDTREPTRAAIQKSDPEYSAQPIISLPPEARNRTQTVVTPPEVQLQHEIPLPNLVAWQRKPQIPIAPVPIVLASEISRLAPRIERPVIAPPPDVADPMRAATVKGPQSAVIEPPPALQADSARRRGDIDIGRSSVIAPAPQLTLDQQRVVMARNSAAFSRQSPQIIAPPPAMAESASSRSRRGLIALNLHPAVSAPPEAVVGNRHGSFAATPEGHRGASGAAAGASAGSGKANGSESANKKIGELPSGLYVGKNAYAVNPNLIANLRPPRLSAHTLQPDTLQPDNQTKLSQEERALFGDRKFYSLSLNMPNLNSAGGSWIIRFAALKADSNSADSNSRATAPNASSGDLSAPSATRKFDPAYPLELMRQNVGGTVILCGVIHADGTVGNIRVLRSVDERLDRFASQAIAKWQFQPAMKNGMPVDVEATFWIPFQPARTGSNF